MLEYSCGQSSIARTRDVGVLNESSERRLIEWCWWERFHCVHAFVKPAQLLFQLSKLLLDLLFPVITHGTIVCPCLLLGFLKAPTWDWAKQ